MTIAPPPESCPECGAELSWNGDTEETTVGYLSPPGHDHDDNCHRRTYTCGNGHRVRGSAQRSCPVPGCDWRGKTDCCGYNGGPKWSSWPSVTSTL